MPYLDKHTHLIRINKDYAICPKEIEQKTILFDEDISKILSVISEKD